MKKNTLKIALSLFILTTFSSCAVIGGIFKTGIGVGIIIVLIVIALIIYFVRKMGKN